jgi:hypothetical protein
VKRQNRPITEQEREWLVQGLQSLATGEYSGGGNWIDCETGKVLPKDEPIDPKPYLDQLDALRVMAQCDCGDPNCHTVHFQGFSPGNSVALVEFHTEDDRMLIILVDRDTDKLAELEII